MDSWRALRLAIPRGAVKAVARRLHVSADYVRRWRREPLSDEAPLATGQRSPLDRMLDLMDAIYVEHPRGVDLVFGVVREHYERLRGQAASRTDRRQAAADALREASEAINALLVEMDDAETEREIIEAIAAFERARRALDSSSSSCTTLGRAAS
jgi:hypothetical protein